MSDRIAIVNRGRIEQLDCATEIYHAPATPFAAEFVGEANLLRAEIFAGGDGATYARLAEGVHLRVRSDRLRAGTARVLLSVRPEKIYITRSRPSKENTFKGAIEAEIFRGAMDELTIRVAGGIALSAMAANESAHQQAWHQGDTVFCTIHADDVVIVEQG